MLFSIITVCFNSAKTIRQTFDSVLQQGFNDYEYIVVDGASTDGTVDIIKEYEPKFEGRMRWISEPDDGIYYAMNKGIAIAHGDYLNFLNSDDYYTDDALAIVSCTIKTHKGYDVYYGLVMLFNDQGNLKVDGIYHTRLLFQPMQHQAIWYSVVALREIGCYDTQFKIGADYDSEITLFKDGYSFLFIPHVLVNFSLGGVSTIEGKQLTYYLENMRILAKHGYCTRDMVVNSYKIKRWSAFEGRIFMFVHRLFLLGIWKRIYMRLLREPY